MEKPKIEKISSASSISHSSPFSGDAVAKTIQNSRMMCQSGWEPDVLTKLDYDRKRIDFIPK